MTDADEPTPDEILAYCEGRINDPEQRRLLEARIAAHPDAARALADLKAFPDVQSAPGAPAPTDEEILETLRRLMERLAGPRSS